MINLKGPAGVVFLAAIAALFAVQWFWPELLPDWIGNTETSYRLLRSGHVAIQGRGGGPFSGPDDYETGSFPALGGETIVLKREVQGEGRVVLAVGQVDWGLVAKRFWLRQSVGSASDSFRVTVPESGFYDLQVRHYGLKGRLTVDWSVE